MKYIKLFDNLNIDDIDFDMYDLGDNEDEEDDNIIDIVSDKLKGSHLYRGVFKIKINDAVKMYNGDIYSILIHPNIYHITDIIPYIDATIVTRVNKSRIYARTENKSTISVSTKILSNGFSLDKVIVRKSPSYDILSFKRDLVKKNLMKLYYVLPHIKEIQDRINSIPKHIRQRRATINKLLKEIETDALVYKRISDGNVVSYVSNKINEL